MRGGCGLQVYPTLVIRGTGLYELWKKGLYHNYEPTQLIDLVARILALVPPWVRVYRIQVHPTFMDMPALSYIRRLHDWIFMLCEICGFHSERLLQIHTPSVFGGVMLTGSEPFASAASPNKVNTAVFYWYYSLIPVMTQY